MAGRMGVDCVDYNAWERGGLQNLPREIGTSGVHEVDARQAALLCDFLHAEVLLHAQRGSDGVFG